MPRKTESITHMRDVFDDILSCLRLNSSSLLVNKKLILMLSFAAVILATMLLYWPGLDGGFILDDFTNVHPVILDYWDYDLAKYKMLTNTSGPLGRPISMISLVFTGLAHGLNPWWFKYHNLMIHLIMGLSLFLFGYRVSKVFLSDVESIFVSSFAAGLWLLHPLFVSTVLYTVQRMAQISSLFLLLGATSYIYARTTACRSPKYILFFVAVPVFLLAAILSKENGALLPLLLLSIELVVGREVGRGNRVDSFARVFLILLPLFAGGVIFFAEIERFTDFSGRGFDMKERLFTQVNVIWFYVGQLLLPNVSKMGIFHDYWVVEKVISIKISVLAILYVAVIAVSIFAKRGGLIRLGMLWFAFGHMLESTILPLEMVFEHRNYMPGWGLLLAVSVLLLKIYNVSKWKRGKAWLPFICLGVFSAMLSLRVSDWEDPKKIAIINYLNHPTSYRATAEMAKIHFANLNYEKGREYIEQMSKIDSELAGLAPPLLSLFSYCDLRSIPQNLLQEKSSDLVVTDVASHSLVAMHFIAHSKKRGKCSWMDEGIIRKIIKTARLSAADGLGYRVIGQLYSSINEFDFAYLYYRTAFSFLTDITLVSEIVELCIKSGRLDVAREFLDEVKKTKRFKLEYELKQIKAIDSYLTRV